MEKGQGKMAVISAFRHLSSYDTARFNQDRVVRWVIPSGLRRGPDKRSTNGKLQGKWPLFLLSVI
jgi:hypothetical protein